MPFCCCKTFASFFLSPPNKKEQKSKKAKIWQALAEKPPAPPTNISLGLTGRVGVVPPFRPQNAEAHSKQVRLFGDSTAPKILFILLPTLSTFLISFPPCLVTSWTLSYSPVSNTLTFYYILFHSSCLLSETCVQKLCSTPIFGPLLSLTAANVYHRFRRSWTFLKSLFYR